MEKGKERDGISIAEEHNACLHMEEKSSEKPLCVWKAPSAGECCAYPAAEKSLEQMVQCRTGDWEEKFMTKALL